MTESVRLADQIRRAFEGNAWHGDSLLELLADVDAKTAAASRLRRRSQHLFATSPPGTTQSVAGLAAKP
jgi:hypothetical protein